MASRLTKQALADEFTLGHASGASKQAAAHVGYELVERVERRHFIEYFNKAGARIALVAKEE